MKLSVKAVAIIIIVSIVLLYSGGMTAYLFNKTDLDISIITDIHLMCEDQIIDINSPSYIAYDEGGQKMKTVSEALLNTAVDEFIKGGSDFLLVAGDLTDDGAKISHLAVAAALKRVEDAGKKVFVINGNHDIMRKSYSFGGDIKQPIENITPEEFAEIYSDFGYSEALRRHPETLSYSVNLNKKYRLISIDTCFYEDPEGKGYCDDPLWDTGSFRGNLLDWTVSEIKDAKSDGMIPIAMTHVPILYHLGEFMSSSVAAHSAVADSENVTKALIDAGLKYVFTGHLHAQDILSSGSGEKTLYDIETASLISFPEPIRNVKFNGEKAKISSYYLDYINEEYIPDFINAEDKSSMVNDFNNYKIDFMSKDMVVSIMNKLGDEALADYLDMLIDADREDLVLEAHNLREDLILEFVYMPINKEDAEAGELSIEGICNDYGISLPDTEFKSMLDLAMSMMRAQTGGTENYTLDAPELTILKYAIYSLFYMIDDYDIFGKLHALDSSVDIVDLTPSLNTLFSEEKLDIVGNGLVAALLNFKIITDILPFSISGNVFAVLTLADAFLEQQPVMGINLAPYIDPAGGYLLIGSLIDNVVVGQVGKDLLIDIAPPDNNVTLYPNGKWK